jgi:hypothetical protein
LSVFSSGSLLRQFGITKYVQVTQLKELNAGLFEMLAASQHVALSDSAISEKDITKRRSDEFIEEILEICVSPWESANQQKQNRVTKKQIAPKKQRVDLEQDCNKEVPVRKPKEPKKKNALPSSLQRNQKTKGLAQKVKFDILMIEIGTNVAVRAAKLDFWVASVVVVNKNNSTLDVKWYGEIKDQPGYAHRIHC